MAKIFINGLSSKIGGGKSILINYLKILKNDINNEHEYFILTPNRVEYTVYERQRVKILEINKFLKRSILIPILYKFYLPKLLQQNNIEILVNLADIPIVTKTNQIFLFDWSYALYPESKVWNSMSFYEHFLKSTKLKIFKSRLKYTNLVLAQTQDMKERLQKLFNLQNVEILPNAVSLDNLNEKDKFDFNLPNGIKLLCLSYYYVHKNFEIFIPLAKLIKQKKLDYKIIITINKGQHEMGDKFLSDIIRFKLDEIIINTGAVPMKYVPSLYKQCDGLLMPTLLESFSGTYVEAMYHEKPIFTSDFDFARSVCKNGAEYFNPFSEEDILKKLNRVYLDKFRLTKLTTEAKSVLETLPSWAQSYQILQNHINALLIK